MSVRAPINAAVTLVARGESRQLISNNHSARPGDTDDTFLGLPGRDPWLLGRCESDEPGVRLTRAPELRRPRLAGDVEQSRRVDLRQTHSRGSGCGITTSIVATSLPSLRTARDSPPGMKQLSIACSTCFEPSPSSTVISPASTT